MLAVLLSIMPAGPAQAQGKPRVEPTSRTGFGLFARAALRWIGNRVHCFMFTNGWLCGAESSVLAGGYWPAGTGNQYIFSSGLQFAGIVDAAGANNPWASDTAGAFFWNARGGGNGQAITDIYDGADPVDLAVWPAEAYVPSDDDVAGHLFDPSLRGRQTASDRDIWFLTWEGDPALSAGRTHPLGVLVETRGLAFSAEGKEDLIFFIFTFYNVTASNPAVYDQAPARIRSRLRELGGRFQQLNSVGGTTLPADGYIIRDMYLGIGTDFDVTSEDAGANYSSVNLPTGTGFTYHHTFRASPTWSFTDASIYRPPFFAGAGFAGVKYLRTPEVNGQQVGLTLFYATTGGGEFSDPRNIQTTYRYLRGQPDPNVGDDQCNIGDPAVTRICYLNRGAASDARFTQATGPMTLAPGESRTVAAAYVFAAPVATGQCTGPSMCGSVRPDVPTGDLTRFTNPAALVFGANTVDSIAGFRGWRDTTFTRRVAGGDSLILPNGQVDAEELITVPSSVLGKAQAAQALFDGRFLSPAPPAAPEFFLIPGPDQVTVIWRPSSTTTSGDPYYAVSQAPLTYDPNYRRFDVAGYRIYRGTRDDPASLRLLAQFDVQRDTMYDHTGQINQVNVQGFADCAPVVGVFRNCASAGDVHGVPSIVPRAIILDGPVTQWRTVVPSGAGIDTVITVDTTVSPPDTTITIVPVNLRAYASRVDTALTGGINPKPPLTGTGVPYSFIDRQGACAACGVRSHHRYFYVVTSFDLNSIRSGPSSQESALTGAKSVVVGPPPVNVSSTGEARLQVLGRRGVLTDTVVPTIDPATGRFSKRFPPANAVALAFQAFVPEVMSDSGTVTFRLDDVELGSSYFPESAVTYHWTVMNVQDTNQFTTTIVQDPTHATRSSTTALEAVPLDSARLAAYGGAGAFRLLAMHEQRLIGTYQSGGWGRGCVNRGAHGDWLNSEFTYPGPPGPNGCDYNGSRWFLGPSPTTGETRSHPTAGNGDSFNPGTVNNAPVVGGVVNGGFNNGGELRNVEVIHQPYSYQTMGNQWREIEGVLSSARRAADYNVYWSAATPGLIDSVVDVTHDVEVPFAAERLGPTFGLLTSAAAQPSGVDVSYDQRAELSLTDFGCMEPLRTFTAPQSRIPCGTLTAGDGPTYSLTRQAAIGPIVHFTGSPANARISTNVGQGFALYLAGNLFMFQTLTLPAGTVWSLRDYVGAIIGGVGFGGNDGPYAFNHSVRPFSAVGASVRLYFTAATTIANAWDRDLRRVHTVPDPYYGRSALEATAAERVIKFVNLPERAIIRIYSVSGVLVTVIEHNSLTSSQATWDLRSRNGRLVASGVYFWHVEALNARRVGRMTVVHRR